MTCENDVSILRAQRARIRKIRKVDGMRFMENGYEYRVTWYGGLPEYVGIERRKIGGRKFRHFGGIGACGCADAEEVMERVMEEVKNGENQ